MESFALDFLNSDYQLTHPPHREILGDAEWWRDLGSRWEVRVPSGFTADTLAQFYDAREFALGMIQTLQTGAELSTQARDQFNRYLGSSPLACRLEPDSAGFHRVFTPLDPGTDGILHLIFADLADLLASRGPGSLKICGNPACGWVFVDESKNKSRKWCCNTCASLMKVRKFRQTHAAQQEGK